MTWKIERKWVSEKAVIGELTIDGLFLCFTLEDPDGAGDRIPAGTYTVILDPSVRFKQLMPHILGNGQDGRGIRIHKGNTAADTEGCVLVGMERGQDMIFNCKPAFDAVMNLLAGQKEPVALLVL